MANLNERIIIESLNGEDMRGEYDYSTFRGLSATPNWRIRFNGDTALVGIYGIEKSKVHILSYLFEGRYPAYQFDGDYNPKARTGHFHQLQNWSPLDVIIFRRQALRRTAKICLCIEKLFCELGLTSADTAATHKPIARLLQDMGWKVRESGGCYYAKKDLSPEKLKLPKILKGRGLEIITLNFIRQPNL